MKTKRMIPVAILVLTSLVLAGCAKETAKPKAAKPVKVKAVESHSAANNVRYSASIRPAAQVEVAFKVSGYVDDIAREKDPAGQWRYIQAGDIVHKGLTLARVRQSDYAARVNEAKSQIGEARSALDANHSQLHEAIAAVDTARAQVNDAKAVFERNKLDYERAKILFSSESITKPEYDATKQQYEVAEAKYEASKGQLKAAEAKVATAQAQISAGESRIRTAEATTASATIPLQDTQLKAPMSAVVIERKVEMGTLVGQGSAAFVLADLSYVKAAFGVPDTSLRSLKLGDTLTITSDATPGTEFSGHISRISPSADQNSRAFEVEVTIPNEQGLLKPGMIASLNTNEGDVALTPALVVPLTAVTHVAENANAYAVLVMEEREGKQFARMRPVTLGESVGNAIVVTNGLKAGEMVVTTGVSQVTDGEQVSVVQ
ncbi:MAG TPA: efflux RND transporter periplasmic adaptor subunit [Pyrinomonadaceae bacterium]|nr:efflux RND transporter periplasmic adaptor subunit [Pyrinomonadaceae bacterium]